jgi:hypothetical protein
MVGHPPLQTLMYAKSEKNVWPDFPSSLCVTFEGADPLHVELRGGCGRMNPVAQGYLAWGGWIAEKEVTYHEGANS